MQICEVDSHNLIQAAEIHAISWRESHKEFCSAEFVAAHTTQRQISFLQEELDSGKKIYLLTDHKPVGIVSVDGEGIIFKLLCNPVEVLGDANGDVCGMRCVEMELGEPDASGRRRPVVKDGSEFVLEIDTMIMSIGTSPNPLIRNTTPGLETNRHGCIVVQNEDGLTSREGVYAGGDAVTGAATVILAMGAGKKAAAAIDEYLKSK